ncbi:MAG: DUF4397 domain-containing protein [Anaerolineae bacterium]
MIKKVLVLLALLTLIVVPTMAYAQSEGAAAVRFVHVLSGAPAVDIYTDGALSYANLSYGEATPYLTVASGSRSLTVTEAGNSGNLLWAQSIDLTASQAVVAVVSSNNPMEFTLFQDDLNPLPVGRARLTAIHAIPGGPNVDILLADGRPVIPGLQYNQPYGTLDIPSQSYEFAITAAGGSATDALIPAATYSLATGTSYIVLAYGTASAPETLVLSAPTLPNSANSGYVRFVNAADVSDAFNVSANDALIVPGLAFGTATEYLAVEAGDYHLSVTVPGVTDELSGTDITVSAGSRSVVVAWVGGGALIVTSNSTDNTSLSASEAQFSLSNVGPTAPASASFAGGQAIVASVDMNDFMSTPVQPSSESIVVTSGSVQGAFASSGVFGGLLYDAIVYPDGTSPAVAALPVASIPLTFAPPVSVTVVGAQPSPTPEPLVLATNPPSVEATATPAPQTNNVQPTPTLPTAVVRLNQGANLHLRLYPSAEAYSMGLAPTGTVFRVLGREGAPEPPSFFTPTPTPEDAEQPTPFIDPVTLLAEDEDLDPRETWLFVEYDTPDGGVITAWVNALYLEVRDTRDRLMKLRDLPTVPRNRAGQLGGQAAGVAPTANPFHNVNVATVNQLAGDANLHLRRYPNAQSESLALIPNGTAMIVSGRTDEGDWLQVEYEGQIGWVAAPYVALSFNDRAIELDSINILATQTPTPTPGAG